MTNAKLFSFLLLLIGFLPSVSGQSFLNLDFENSTVSILFPPSPGFPYERGIAQVEYWGAAASFVTNYSGGTLLLYNTRSLDATGVFLEGASYPIPAIQGNYSVLLDGGSSFYPGREGALLGQTGEIPPWARSLTFWSTSGSFEASFDAQPLSLVLLSTASNHAVYGADVSAYAGLTGHLQFRAPWQSMGLIDAIQFSPNAIPEPTLLSLFTAGVLCVVFVRLKAKKF